MTRGLAVAATLAMALAGGAASAQTRPLQTETATTASAGTTTLEVGGSWIASEPNFLTGAQRDRWAFPGVRLVHAPADGIELDLEWAGFVGAVDDPDFGSTSDSGDFALRAKWRFLRRDTGWSLGARFQVTLPQAGSDDGLGPNTLRFSAQLLATRTAGPWALHANAGLAIQDQIEDPGLQSDFLHYGLAVERRLSPSWQVAAEVSGLAGSGSAGTESRSEARLGARVGAGRAVWDVAVRRGLAEADGTWGLTAGLTWRLSAAKVASPPVR